MMKTDFQHFPAPPTVVVLMSHQCRLHPIAQKKGGDAAPHLGLLLALHLRIR